MFTSAQLIAALIGVLCGTFMIATLIYIPIFLGGRAKKKNSHVKNDFMPQEMLHSYIPIVATFLFATIAIFIWHLIVPDTLIWFSVPMIFWYLIGFSVYAVQKIVKESNGNRENNEGG